MKMEDLEVLNRSMEIGESVWDIVKLWKFFEKDTIGKQFIRSIDSVAANIAEGYGRYHYGESKHFFYYSRGSLYESKIWLKKANLRGLINDEDYNRLSNEMNTIGIKLNKYINHIKRNQKNNKSK
jgi:four helix bundle protein